MNNLFTFVTAPLQAIWEAFSSLLVDTGVTIGGLILTGVFMSILIGVITHISVSGARLKSLFDRKDKNNG